MCHGLLHQYNVCGFYFSLTLSLSLIFSLLFSWNSGYRISGVHHALIINSIFIVIIWFGEKTILKCSNAKIVSSSTTKYQISKYRECNLSFNWLAIDTITINMYYAPVFSVLILFKRRFVTCYAYFTRMKYIEVRMHLHT